MLRMLIILNKGLTQHMLMIMMLRVTFFVLKLLLMIFLNLVIKCEKFSF